jgi:predicted ABC-type ATPase
MHKNPAGPSPMALGILEAVGLPLGEVNGPMRRNPTSSGSVDPEIYAGLTVKQKKVVDLLVPAIQAALPTEMGPYASTVNFVNYEVKYEGRTPQWNLASEIDHLLRSVWSGDVGTRPEPDGVGQYLRVLVIARALGMWRHILDPGNRVVYRGGDSARKFIGNPNGSFRLGNEGLQQVRAMAALDGSTFSDDQDGVKRAILRWLDLQSTGTLRFVRSGFGGTWGRLPVGSPADDSGSNYPPDYDWTTGSDAERLIAYNATEYDNNIEGFNLDFYPQSFEKFGVVEFSSSPGSYGSQREFMFRARTSDPRFVFLPAGTMKGRQSNSYEHENAILFVAIDDTPLSVDVLIYKVDSHGSLYDYNDRWYGPRNCKFGDGRRLSQRDINAYHEARPSYPKGPIPEGPAKPLYTMLRNPGGRRAGGAPSLRHIGKRLQAFVLRKNPHDNAIRDCAAALGPQRAPAKGQPRVTFLMGPAGSGKSTWAQLTYARSPKSVILDSDLLKKAHPQWTPGSVATPELHQWSVATQEAVYRQLLAEAKPGEHVVYDGTGSWAPALAERIAEARKQGWFVEFAVVLVPLDVAIRRVGERVTGGGHGVPEWKIREQAAMVADTFCELAPLADRVIIADNSQPRKIDESGGLLARSKRFAAHIVSQAIAQ